jgi:hypothetical protein
MITTPKGETHHGTNTYHNKLLTLRKEENNQPLASNIIELHIKGAEHLRAHRTITLPSLLNLIALDLTQRASNSNTTRQIRTRDLLHESESTDLVLPVSNIYNKKCQSASPSSKP